MVVVWWQVSFEVKKESLPHTKILFAAPKFYGALTVVKKNESRPLPRVRATTMLSVASSSSSFSSGIIVLTTILVVALFLPLVPLATAQSTYGVDISFPQHHATILSSATSSSLPPLLLPGRQDFYDHFLETCRSHNTKPEICDENEVDRIDMNIRQPQSMVNYTSLGYAKVKVPRKVFKIIQKFWTDNVGREEVEDWDMGNTYTNHVST